MKKAGPFFLFILCLTISFAARAETLDDQSIRKIYDENDAAMKDAEKTKKLLEERLAENFVLTSDTIIHVHDTTKEKNETKNKAEVMSDTARAYQSLDIQDHHHTIDSITYSDDKKFAYVNDESVSTGAIKAPAANGGQTYSITQKQSGTDTLSLVGDTIQIVKTARRNELTISEK